jgi:hypothetical protein
MLRHRPSNKSVDAFWPIGIFQARTASSLVIQRISEFDAHVRFDLPWSPTALLNLYYSLALGSRAAQVPTSVAVDVGGRILAGVDAGKPSGLINADGTNRLTVLEGLISKIGRLLTCDGDLTVDKRRLSVLALAYSEAAAFIGHRTITELHGPYGEKRDLLVRTVNLDLLDASIDRRQSKPYDRLLIVTKVNFSPIIPPVLFDLWGHPTFSVDAARRQRCWVLGMVSSELEPLSAGAIGSCCEVLEDNLRLRLARVSRMSPAERCAELGRIMLRMALLAAGRAYDEITEELASFPRRVQPGTRWRGGRPEFLRALDLRTEWNDAHLLPRHA